METGIIKNDTGVTPSPLMQLRAAITSKIVSDCSLLEVFNAVNIAVLRAYLDTGYKQPTGTVYIGTDQPVNLFEAMVNELAVYVRSRLCTLRIDEIGLAISNGCLGDAGDFTGLNKKTFVQFLTVHHNNQQRKLQIANRAASEEPKRPAPSYQDQFNTAKYNAVNAYSAYVDGKDIDRFGALVYDFLHSLGLITYSEEDNTKVYHYAKMRVMSEAKAERINAPNIFARQILQNRIDAMQSNQVAEGSRDENLIFLRAKSLTTTRYFNDVKLSGSNIETLIEGKRKVFYKLLADKNNA